MTETKHTNPKDAVGVRKLAFSVLPWRVLTFVALAMLEGALKYGRHNYRAAGVRASVYFDAVVARHLTDWWEGIDIDPDSNLHHVDKAIAGLMVMRDSMLQGNFVDDRPPRGPGGALDMARLNQLAAALHDRHADKSPRHYTIADTIADSVAKNPSGECWGDWVPWTAGLCPGALHRAQGGTYEVREHSGKVYRPRYHAAIAEWHFVSAYRVLRGD